MNILLEARTNRLEIAEVAIETIYLDHNTSSHFRPLIDSARIYADGNAASAMSSRT